MVAVPKPQTVHDRRDWHTGLVGYCEWCKKGPPVEKHHVRSRGAGGPTIRLNRVELCVPGCHERAQRYQIPQDALIAIVAAREGVTEQAVRVAIGLEAP